MKLVLIHLNRTTEHDLFAALQTFSDERKAALGRCKSAKNRADSIVAEVCVRLEIMQTLRVSNAEIGFSHTNTGKPLCRSFPDFCFNVSHSGDYAACAFGASPVGVDVERVHPLDLSALAARCFSDGERGELAQKPDPIRTFFRLWTAKESVVKFRGSSLARDLRALDVSGEPTLGGQLLPCAVASYGLACGQDRLLPPDEPFDYALSICCAPPPAPAAVCFRSADELLHEYLRAV